jgi:hypothetical protein
MTTGVSAAAIARLNWRDADKLAASVTLAVKVKLPVAVGVPVSAPPVVNVNPAGSAPEETVHVYGSVPPLANKVCEYA